MSPSRHKFPHARQAAFNSTASLPQSSSDASSPPPHQKGRVTQLWNLLLRRTDDEEKTAKKKKKKKATRAAVTSPTVTSRKSPSSYRLDTGTITPEQAFGSFLPLIVGKNIVPAPSSLGPTVLPYQYNGYASSPFWSMNPSVYWNSITLQPGPSTSPAYGHPPALGTSTLAMAHGFTTANNNHHYDNSSYQQARSPDWKPMDVDQPEFVQGPRDNDAPCPASEVLDTRPPPAAPDPKKKWSLLNRTHVKVKAAATQDDNPEKMHVDERKTFKAIRNAKSLSSAKETTAPETLLASPATTTVPTTAGSSSSSVPSGKQQAKGPMPHKVETAGTGNRAVTEGTQSAGSTAKSGSLAVSTHGSDLNDEHTASASFEARSGIDMDVDMLELDPDLVALALMKDAASKPQQTLAAPSTTAAQDPDKPVVVTTLRDIQQLPARSRVRIRAPDVWNTQACAEHTVDGFRKLEGAEEVELYDPLAPSASGKQAHIASLEKLSFREDNGSMLRTLESISVDAIRHVKGANVTAETFVALIRRSTRIAHLAVDHDNVHGLRIQLWDDVGRLREFEFCATERIELLDQHVAVVDAPTLEIGEGLREDHVDAFRKLTPLRATTLVVVSTGRSDPAIYQYRKVALKLPLLREVIFASADPNVKLVIARSQRDHVVNKLVLHKEKVKVTPRNVMFKG
ncbi:hypothetical protein EXIGLDRAFT_755631 [Exidia glandulosa HHB12029]|uniref:Uncharacterized protein n=1 Tax=Exidia glandulosa HHB12029 TaxID=1314781 RepID=A0A165BWB2_EXIGL|nr:hypothetical protein EXIGLDRAFT_755631 [Exidia glandulosa HHB12029]